MSLEDLQAFLVVAEHGSFLSAAVALGVSRTTLRRQVDCLEATTGVPLLQRDSTGVVLTDAGRRLLGGGREMEQGFTALMRSVRETGKKPEGDVRMLLQNGLPPSAMAALFSMFRTSWPDLRLATRFAEAPLASALSDVDVLVWFGSAAPCAAWESHTVLPVRQRLVASAAYLAKHGMPTSLDDLRSHDVMCWLPSGETNAKLLTTFGGTQNVKPSITSTNIDFLHECARSGLGIAWVPDIGLRSSSGAELIPVLDRVVGGTTELRIAIPKAMAHIPKLRIFAESLDAMRGVLANSSVPTFPAPVRPLKAA
jgi:DNA-binding transcriptional LysR family regulator